MADKYITKGSTFKGIADAIRSKRGMADTELIKVSNMASEIMAISLSDDVVLTSITITPTGEEIIEIPRDASGFGMVTVTGDRNLIAENIKKGEKIYGVTGTYEAIDTSDATATPEDILIGATAYVNGEKITGTHVCESSPPDDPDYPDDPDDPGDVPVLNDVRVEPTGQEFTITPEEGIDGFFSVEVAGDENLVPENILRDVTIYGVTGTADSLTDAYLQEKQVTPTAEEITVTADENYAALSKVTVLGDAQLKPENIRAGVEIFGVSGGLTDYDKPLMEYKVTPSKESQTVVPDSDHSGFSKVVVNGDDNLVASNIRKGVTIFGITGTNEGGEDSPMVMGDVVFYGTTVELSDVAISEEGGS